MNGPRCVEVDLHHIYISDIDNHRVLVYSKQNSAFLFQIGQGRGCGHTQLSGPWGVSVDSEAGVVYVADSENHRVCVYRSGDGSYVRHFQVLQADNSHVKPLGVMWHAATGVLYVTSYNSAIGVYEI
eukprot:TRINITY_DN8591_c0_g5_i1.p2 TRINITY_DN8591_c0_g5~~TRINITY_DN8591_c0_g5_i1.p2  ORF type:complete len:127 (+),score=27.33 TRINITY_DN8591_c0_g5_i1:211-591(+)